jgi:hypothetical protein
MNRETEMGRGGVFLGDAHCGAAPCDLTFAHVRMILPAGSVFVDDNGCTGELAGIQVSDDGSLRFARPGRFHVQSCIAPSCNHRDADDAQGGDQPLRNAQFMCGVFGLLMINAIIFFDVESRLANIKDFAINYASDMLAVGSILVLAECYIKRTP